MKPLFTWLMSGFLFLIQFILPNFADCQSLSDFQAAAQNKGVQSIPFSSLRSDAGSIQSDIETWKKNTASFEEWKTYDRNKAENYRQIRMQNETIKKAQDNIASLKSRNVDASQFEKDLEKELKKVKDYNQDIEAINYQVSKAVDAWDKLARLRGLSREKFSDVLYKLSNAKSSPNQYLGSNPTEEDKTRLNGYITTIETGIKEEAVRHARAEKECYDAKQNMENVLRRSGE